ncbi:MAG TPA: hypothetical protein GXZ98_10335 [Firmicutes bacterium]|jgi:uncharacterized protein (DUF697 family)|nr:hypothetical protein [Bacillota bacterium]
MRKGKIQDERILNQRRQIGNDAFQILFWALLLSILIQLYLFGAAFAQYAVEFILLLGISGYVIIRNIIAGNDLFESEYSQKQVVVKSLVTGLLVAAVNTMLNYIKFRIPLKGNVLNSLFILGITFLSVSVLVFAVLESIYLFNKKRQKQIESMLDKEDGDGQF